MRRVLFFSLCTAFLAVSVTSCDKDDDFDAEILEGIDEQGAIIGKFSVSPNLQVQFSRGNLQYQASTNTWKFADHQYDVIDIGNYYRSETYSGWIDLFFRGTSGYDPLLPPYMSYPYYNKDSVFFNGQNPGYYFIKFDISGTPWDWGSNAISNGGNTPNKWWTMKSVHWDYLIRKRENADKLFGLAIVNNKYGLIILPDNWNMPEGLDFNGINTIMDIDTEGFYWSKTENHTSDATSYGSNVYNKSEWTKMQQNGAVFLPIARNLDTWRGKDGVTMVEDINIATDSHYWSSSCIYSDTEYSWNQYYTPTIIQMGFSYAYVNAIGGMCAYDENAIAAVRLVKDAE